MLWLGYRRVSSVGGRDETLISPDVQARRIEAYASARGYAVEMLPPELNVSGAKVIRPILEGAVARIRAGEAEGIIVADLSRLSRMVLSDALATLERIEGVGGQVISVAENVDPTTPEGRMARNMFLSVAELQRGQYRRHTIVAKRQAVERGIWPMPYVPRGYVRGEDRHLVPGPDGGRVRKAFEMRASGASWHSVAELLGCGYSGAGKTIHNRVYLGEIRLSVDGEDVVNRAAHQPIVPRDLWESAQLSMPRPSMKAQPSLLGGLIRCGHCSRLMSPGGVRYRCFPRNVAGWCPSPPTIAKKLVEPHVEKVVLSYLRKMTASAAGREVGIAEQSVLEDAEAELAAFQEGIAAAGVGAEHVASGLRTRVDAVEAASAALGRARGAVARVTPDINAAGVYQSLGVAERRQVLRRSLGVIWVWKGRGLDRVALVEAGMEPTRLSKPGRSDPLVSVERDVPGQIGVSGIEGGGECRC